MRVFKVGAFKKWAESEMLDDSSLWEAVVEMNDGLVDANLGGDVYKKRVPLPGRGKRGGARTLLAFRAEYFSFTVLPKTSKTILPKANSKL